MKRLFVLSTIITASLIANSAYSQVFVNAHVGFRLPVPPIPVPHVYCEAAPAPVVYEQYPEATYYTYPAWNGHYRDQVYYEHYRPYYERGHRVAYNDHREYDHRDYDHRDYDHRGYDHRDYDHRGYDHREEHGRDR